MSTLHRVPPEDSGAHTFDRYEWQAHTAVIDLMALTTERLVSGQTDLSKLSIICEHHEDYILCIDGKYELVSVKHRDAGSGSWTFASIFTDGGLNHLFHRWHELEENVTARLVTNAGLSSGDSDRLRTLCERLRGVPIGPLSSSDTQYVVTVAKRILASVVNQSDRDDWADANAEPTESLCTIVRRFLASLVLDCERISRRLLPAAVIGMYVHPLLTAMNLPLSGADVSWQTISSLVRGRMRGRDGQDHLAYVSVLHGMVRATPGSRIEQQVLDRTISGADLLESIRLARTLSIKAIEDVRSPAPTTLAVKLINAGCRNTTVFAAEAAAKRWRLYELDLAGGVGMDAALERIKLRLLIVASAIQESEHSSAAGEDYGPAMWSRLIVSLAPDSFEDDVVVIDRDLALGLACDLASQCQVWFSEEFDIDAAREAFPERLALDVTGAG